MAEQYKNKDKHIPLLNNINIMHKKILTYPKKTNYELKHEALRQTLLRGKQVSVNDLIFEYIQQGLEKTENRQRIEMQEIIE